MKIKLFSTKYGLYFLFFVIYLLWSSFLMAQNKFLLNVDIAQFLDSEEQPYLDIYYSIPAASIKYLGDKKKDYACSILTTLHIYQNDSLWASKLWKIEQSIDDTTQLSSKQIVDVLRYPVDKSGVYRIILHARDLNYPEHIDSVKVKLDVQIPSQENIIVSDIELAYNIKKADSNSQGKFTKYGYEISPNPVGFYGEGLPDLYYYYEAYNLLKNVPGNKYKTLCMIKEYKGNILEDLVRPYRTKIKRYDRGIEFGKVDVSKLHTGIYILTYGICDSVKNLLVSKQKEFFIHNPSIAITKEADDKLAAKTQSSISILNGMNEEELDLEFDKMYYLTNKNQRKIFKNLNNPEAKKKFVYSIWNSSIKDQNTSLILFRQQYLQRVEQAGKKFQGGFRAGWKTDQGRVFILYGPPSNIDRHLSTTSTKPYQIWQYDHLENGVYFVFIDRRGKYELVHSTLRGELQEPNWERLISTTINMR